ncbi:50S ribosomal protein L4 [Methanohalophilus mahii]|uniref:Large ribosomal subunit protein uL4 n=1 Tax=Methanohalophilus mahii (strain ATCC 35705 / DSM 5219 / SLP) TaxID=547558 RepID=D5E6S6_METMS|nr:50S ribosomal protein L4 [Methanohalophilus mahii]ADE36864.1 LSU ribosomal protein L4P [Methanohalophilus mahii DSM 5219]
MVTANILDISGNSKGEITLPDVFEEIYRPDLIKRTVLSSQSKRYQPYGPKMYAGMETSAVSWGSGRGVAQIPRLVNGSRVARVPQAVGGRRTHPPKPEADRTEKVNKKEKRLAVRSAIAATINAELVKGRGHVCDSSLPIVAEDALQDVEKTAEVIKFLKTAGAYDDVLRAKDSRSIRAGKGKMRGRKYKHKKSVLIVAGSESPIFRSARNLSGVDVTTVDSLYTELLAPGAKAGRLTVWTESAISSLEDMFI